MTFSKECAQKLIGNFNMHQLRNFIDFNLQEVFETFLTKNVFGISLLQFLL